MVKTIISYNVPGLCEVRQHRATIGARVFEGTKVQSEKFDEIDEFAGKGIIESEWCSEKSRAEEIEKHCDIIAVEEGKDAACPVCGGFGYKIRVAKTY